MSVVTELQGHWKRQQEERLSLGLGRAGPEDLIFAMPDGSPLEPDTLSRNWMNNTLAATGNLAAIPVAASSPDYRAASNLHAQRLRAAQTEPATAQVFRLKPPAAK